MGDLIMRDSVDATLIPRDTAVVAGYADGAFIWSPSWRDGSNWWDLFPSAVQLTIVVNPAHSGDILDVERGDATPGQVPGWCRAFTRSGRRRPTVYSSRSMWEFVKQALSSAGIVPGDRFWPDWWAATLDGTRAVDGAVAVQFQDLGGYDESVVLDPAWAGLQEADMTPDQAAQLNSVYLAVTTPHDVVPGGQAPTGMEWETAWSATWLQTIMEQAFGSADPHALPPLESSPLVRAVVAALPSSSGGASVTMDQVQQVVHDAVQPLVDVLARLESAFKQA